MYDLCPSSEEKNGIFRMTPVYLSGRVLDLFVHLLCGRKVRVHQISLRALANRVIISRASIRHL